MESIPKGRWKEVVFKGPSPLDPRIGDLTSLGQGGWHTVS